MESNQTLRDLRSRFDEAQQAAVALAEALQAAAGTAPPRSRHDVCRVAAGEACAQCWQRPGRPCTSSGPPGYHVARFSDCRRKGLISAAEMAAVLAMAGHVFTNSTIIRDGAR